MKIPRFRKINKIGFHSFTIYKIPYIKCLNINWFINVYNKDSTKTWIITLYDDLRYTKSTKQTEFKKVIKPYNLALTNTDRKHYANTLYNLIKCLFLWSIYFSDALFYRYFFKNEKFYIQFIISYQRLIIIFAICVR